VKDENGDLLKDSHNILNRWKNYFSQLLNVHNVSDVRQIEVHIAQPLVSVPSHLEVEIAIAKLKKYKSCRRLLHEFSWIQLALLTPRTSCCG
jgi:hypothetical protein